MNLSAANLVAESSIDFLSVIVAVAVGLLMWLVATFVIRKVTRKIANGKGLAGRNKLRWAAPALSAIDSQRRQARAQTVGSLLNSLVTVVISVVVVIYVLQALGVDILPLLTSVGVVGIAIGFGSQQLIRDYLAGIFLSIEDQYGIGDRIVALDMEGTVISVGLRITKVLDDDGTIWYLRNGEIMRVGNRSKGNYVPRGAQDPESPEGTNHG